MGRLLKLKCAHSPLDLRILSSTRVPFALTTVQVQNIALTHTKRNTVHLSYFCRTYSDSTYFKWPADYSCYYCFFLATYLCAYCVYVRVHSIYFIFITSCFCNADYFHFSTPVISHAFLRLSEVKS
jgi:hypothetical protein